MGHDATPLLLVVPVQFSLPLSENTTGSLATGRLVFVSMSVPETVVASAKSLVPGFTVRAVGSVTVIGVDVVVEVS